MSPLRMLAVFAVAFLSVSTAAAEIVVQPVLVDDWKAVFGQINAIDRTAARTRISGTLRQLTVDEGDLVKKDERLAVVVDEKLELQLVGLEARLKSLTAREALAQTTLKRAGELRRKGTISQARLDEAQTNLDVMRQEVAALRAEQRLVRQRIADGAVIAPSDGRVLRVDIVEGAVVAPGENVAIIAADQYVLRLRLPERHAKFVAPGDPVRVGARGAGDEREAQGTEQRIGRIRQIYPQITDGRVLADVTVEGLGTYFVGERVRVWLATGKRRTFLIPQDHLGTRFGVAYVRLADGREVVVQPGLRRDGAIEILSGLRAGDKLVKP